MTRVKGHNLRKMIYDFSLYQCIRIDTYNLYTSQLKAEPSREIYVKQSVTHIKPRVKASVGNNSNSQARFTTNKHNYKNGSSVIF